MNEYLPNKQEHNRQLTRHHVYHTVYEVIKYENSHLGEDKASRVANQAAVKLTWELYNDPHSYAKYVNAYVEHIMNEVGVDYGNND